jgi:transposase
MGKKTDIKKLESRIDFIVNRLTHVESENAELRAENAVLRSENTLLKSQLSQNSSNSHKPPSSDGLTKQPAIPRLKGGKTGGQLGHDGQTLKMSSQIDDTVIHKPSVCKECGTSLVHQVFTLCEKRQVFEIPEPKLIVTQHEQYRCQCTCGCQNWGIFPSSVNAPIQYGNNARTFASLLNQQYLLPLNQVSSIFDDLYGQPINESTIINSNRQLYALLEQPEQLIKSALTKSKVVHFDETGARTAGKLNWLHSASNKDYTYYFHHLKRGYPAMIDAPSVLPLFCGYAVHDCWASYFKFDACQHVLCNSHLFRELQAATERGFEWAQAIKQHIFELYDIQKKHKDHIVCKEQYQKSKAIIKSQLEIIEAQLSAISSRNSIQQKALALVKRIRKQLNSFLFFAQDPDLPFTNNQAERDIRMVKLKIKISGAFRTVEGIQIFARIRGFISTCKKQNINVFKSIRNILNGDSFDLTLS